MLRPYRSLLSAQSVVLASGSERRRHILATMADLSELMVVKSDCKEDLDKALYLGRPEQYALDTARLKAEDVFEHKLAEVKNALVIAADTIVVRDDDFIVEKARDTVEAMAMLNALVQAQSHRVITGCCIRSRILGHADFVETTKVFFDHDLISTDMIEQYVTNEPNVCDMAGAYGIQTAAGTFISRIEGDYYNVMGMPLNKLCRTLVRLCQKQQCKRP